MEARREQAMVGLFVIVAAVVLVATVFGITGAFGRSGEDRFMLIFRSPADWNRAPRCATRVDRKLGGYRSCGSIRTIRRRIEMTLEVQSDLPVKTDSHVKIMSMSPLGDNHLEIVPGSAEAPLAENGASCQRTAIWISTRSRSRSTIWRRRRRTCCTR